MPFDVTVVGFSAVLITALVIELIAATVGLVLKMVLLPFIILTPSVVYFLISGLMFKLTSEFVPGFGVNGSVAA
ncbi:MAG TPA: phage holin family protein [Bryobacteraceae bacterium]